MEKLKFTKIEHPKFEGMDDLALNISNDTQRIINHQMQHQEKILEHCLRTMAEPPIKGDITKGKIRWRGIKLIKQKTDKGYRNWVEQRGKKISPTIIIEYPTPNFG